MTSFSELLALRVGFAAAQATQNPICFSLIPELFPAERTTAMAAYNSAIYMGRALSFAAVIIAGQLGVTHSTSESIGVQLVRVPVSAGVPAVPPACLTFSLPRWGNAVCVCLASGLCTICPTTTAFLWGLHGSQTCSCIVMCSFECRTLMLCTCTHEYCWFWLVDVCRLCNITMLMTPLPEP